MSLLEQVDPRERQARTRTRDWLARARTYARTNIKQMLIFGGVSFAVAWVLNVWLMADHYDGFRTPSGAPATGTGNFFRGSIFYLFASALITSVISYRLLVGSERFWREIYGIPSSIKLAFTSDSDQTLLHLLVGFAGAMLIVLIVGPSVALALAVGSLLAFTPLLRPLVTGALLTVYRSIIGRVAPKRTAMPPTVAMLVGVSGSIGAFGLGGALPTSSVVAVGVAAVIAAIVIAQRRKPSAPALVLTLLAGVLSYWLGDVAIALADDGGFAECGNPGWSEWWSNCQGAGRVVERSYIGATGAGIGGVIGAALGGSADTGTGGGGSDDDDRRPPSFEDLPPGIQERILTSGIRRDHPDWDVAEVRGEVDRRVATINRGRSTEDEESYLDWMRESARYTADWWSETADATRRRLTAEARMLLQLDGGQFWTHFVDNYTEDVKSGEAFRRAGLTAQETASQTWEKGEALIGALGSSEVRAEVLEWLMSNEPGELARNPALAAFNLTADEIARVQGKFRELELASGGDRIDNEAVAKIIGDLASDAEVGAIIGGLTEAVVVRGSGGLDHLTRKTDELAPPVRPPVRDKTPDADGVGRPTGVGDEAVQRIQTRANDVKVDTTIDPDILRRRDELMAKAREGDGVRLTIDEADELFAIDRRITDNRQGTILQISEGAAEREMSTVYKLGDENGLIAKQLRTEYGDIWTGKWNPVNDKGFKPGEELFMSADDLKRFEANPLQPGETINYTPKRLSADEIADLPDGLRDQYFARQKDAAGWDRNTGFDARREVDYSQPGVRDRYGDMWVAEDTANPVQKAEFWKDPDDSRVYVRYQTKDGTWSAPQRQASDIDTVTHSGGDNVSYETSRDLQYNQSFGQLGEGDTPNWGMSFLEPDSAGGYVIRNPADKDMVFKAIDHLYKADGQLVLKQDLDGLLLTKAEFPELENLANAAGKADWSPEQAASLKQWGIIP